MIKVGDFVYFNTESFKNRHIFPMRAVNDFSNAMVVDNVNDPLVTIKELSGNTSITIPIEYISKDRTFIEITGHYSTVLKTPLVFDIAGIKYFNDNYNCITWDDRASTLIMIDPIHFYLQKDDYFKFSIWEQWKDVVCTNIYTENGVTFIFYRGI